MKDTKLKIPGETYQPTPDQIQKLSQDDQSVQNFLEDSHSFRERAAAMDLPGDKEIAISKVSLRNLVRMGLAHYLNRMNRNIARFVIEYDDAAGKGWMWVTSTGCLSEESPTQTQAH